MEEATKKIDFNDLKKVHPLYILAFIETFLFVLFFGFIIGKSVYSKKPQAENVITSITEKLTEVAELVTLQYDYDAIDRITSDKARWYGIGIPNTEDVVEIIISGTIRFGINLRDVRIIADEDSKGNIKVKIPKAKIISHELDHKSANIRTVKGSIYNNLQQSFSEILTTANEAFMKIKDEKEKTEKIQECLETATENAKNELRILLKPIIPKDKSIQFEFIE